MKKPVLQRSMFMAVVPKSESKGIVTGMDDEDDYEDRRPDSLEIIANNLRGDMRSMDERYLELAQMVGEAAFETPEEVVTLMQSQLAQQPQQPIPAPAPSQQGLGALAGGPAGPTVPPPTGGIVAGMGEQPPMPPQGQPPMPPQGQPPVQMANGGIVYRANGSTPSGETKFSNLNERLMESQRRPGVFSRVLGGAKDLTANIDERVSQALSRQLQTTGPVSASGNPIPFVDKQGRFYQPIGGTNPNMPSRGMPMPSRFNLGRFATRFGGPVGILGGLATDALIESDPSRGQLYGSMFDLETGAGAGERPGSATAIPTTAAVPRPSGPVEMPGERVPAAPEPGAPGGMTTLPGMKPPGERLVEKEPSAEFTRVTPEMYKRREDMEPEKGYRERVQEKMDLYSEFLGSDPEMRKAQALFLLAEAALNVAGATGRSTAERLSKGLKGLPAGMAALGAEAEKDKRAIAAAAISSVEQEYTDARRATAAIQRELAKKGPGISDKVRSIASSALAREPDMDPNVAIQFGKDVDNGTLIRNSSTGEWYDTLLQRFVPGPGAIKPLRENEVGFLDTSNPYVRVSPETMTVTHDPDVRKKLIDERMKLQKNLTMYDRFMKDVYGDTVGVLPSIRSGVSQVVLGLFGDIGFGLTDTQLNQVRDNQAIGNEFIKKGLFRNSDRVSNLDMKNADSLANNPNALFTDVPLVIGTVQNFQRADINRLSEIDSQLFGTPRKELDRVPKGSKTDPLPVTRGTDMILRDAFSKRPNLSMHLRFSDGRIQKVDINHPDIQKLLRGTEQ